MAEPVEQAVLFKAAQKIVEVRLVKLDAVVLCGWRRNDARRIGRGNAVFGKQRLDDLDRRPVHPDTAIRAARQKPHLRAEGHGVRAQTACDRRAFMQLRHQAVERAANTAAIPLALADLDRDIDQPTDQFLGLDRFFLGSHGQADVEELRHAFLDRQALWQKLIFAQRRLHPENAARLDEIGKRRLVGHGTLLIRTRGWTAGARTRSFPNCSSRQMRIGWLPSRPAQDRYDRRRCSRGYC